MKSLIVVDIQPVYDDVCGHLLFILNELFNDYDRIFIFYNDEEICCDSLFNIIEYYSKFINDDNLAKFTYIPKQYAFFRDFMDHGIDREEIIKIIQHMINNNIIDSRDIISIDMTEYNNIGNIYIPDIDMNIFSSNIQYDLIGGSYYECLDEIAILLESYNISYDILQPYVY